MMILNHEALHTALYQAHDQIRTAKDSLHKVIVALHDAGRYAEERRKIAPIIELLSKARDDMDNGLSAAGNGRTELIRLTGCSGNCHT